MWSPAQRLLAAGGGAIAAVALLGGVVLAQTPGGTPTPTPDTQQAQPGQSPEQPRQRGDKANCPEKDGAQGGSSQGAGFRGPGPAPGGV
jgi:hypothetical protein